LPNSGAAYTQSPPPQQGSDVLSIAKDKMAKGQPLNPEEAQAISWGATSNDVNVLKNQPGQKGSSPALSPQQITINKQQGPIPVAAPFPRNQPTGPAADQYGRVIPPVPASGISPASSRLIQGPSSPQASPVPAASTTVPVIPITSTPIKPVAENALPQPVTSSPQQTMDNFKAFLAGNPPGDILANIADAIGTSLSARGGVQRQTRLQQQYGAQLQARQAAAIAAVNQANELQLKSQDLANQIAIAQATGKIEQANTLVAQKAELDRQLALIKPQMQANIEQERQIKGLEGVAQGGGIRALARGDVQ